MVSVDAPPKIVFSNANFGLSLRALHSPGWLGEFVQAAEFDGVEIHPLFFSAESIASAGLNGALSISSLHQSFREAKISRGTNTDIAQRSARQKIIDSPLGRPVMPDMVGSAAYYGRSTKKAWQSLAGNFLPSGQPAGR